MDSISHTRTEAHDEAQPHEAQPHEAQPYELIIFDCDGVLVDSERITARVFADMLGELGLAVTLQDIFDRFVGKSLDQCLEIVSRSLGREVPPGFALEYRTRSEDTPTGVSAGVAAGMTVYGYCELTPAHRLTEAGAHRTFDRMERLPALLRSKGLARSKGAA